MTAADKDIPRQSRGTSHRTALLLVAAAQSNAHEAPAIGDMGGSSGAALAGSGGSAARAGASAAHPMGGVAGAPPGEGGSGALVLPGGRGGSGEPEGGAAGDDVVTCSVNALLNAIEIPLRQPIASCAEASPTLGPNESLSRTRGAVVIDDEGRVIDITGVSGDTKQEWLGNLADQRWPCLAGQTIGYWCTTFH
jgi:hypothetical protein